MIEKVLGEVLLMKKIFSILVLAFIAVLCSCQATYECGMSNHIVYDEIGHWHSCDYCEEKGEYAEHVYTTDCDEDCEVCGYVRTAPVQHDMQQQIDDMNHWNECQNCHKQTGNIPCHPEKTL